MSPLPVFFLALQVGAYPVSPSEMWRLLALTPSQSPLPEQIRAIIVDVRLPRIVLAMLVGLSLSVSGATLQAVFRNPLVDAFILGVSAGAVLVAARGQRSGSGGGDSQSFASSATGG